MNPVVKYCFRYDGGVPDWWSSVVFSAVELQHHRSHPLCYLYSCFIYYDFLNSFISLQCLQALYNQSSTLLSSLSVFQLLLLFDFTECKSVAPDLRDSHLRLSKHCDTSPGPKNYDCETDRNSPVEPNPPRHLRTCVARVEVPESGTEKCCYKGTWEENKGNGCDHSHISAITVVDLIVPLLKDGIHLRAVRKLLN